MGYELLKDLKEPYMNQLTQQLEEVRARNNMEMNQSAVRNSLVSTLTTLTPA